MKNWRLFIAINFNEEIKEKLLTIQEGLRGCALHGNFTRRENLHLTLIFLGEVPQSQIKMVEGAMEELTYEAFSLSMGGLGRFKRGTRGRGRGDVWWVGIQKNPILNKVYQTLSSSLSRYGFETEKRDYKPHLTIAREVVLKDGVDVKQKVDAPFIDTFVSKISLMKSERVNGELTYTEVFSKDLFN